jgi:hypothetical protein
VPKASSSTPGLEVMQSLGLITVYDSFVKRIPEWEFQVGDSVLDDTHAESSFVIFFFIGKFQTYFLLCRLSLSLWTFVISLAPMIQYNESKERKQSTKEVMLLQRSLEINLANFKLPLPFLCSAFFPYFYCVVSWEPCTWVMLLFCFFRVFYSMVMCTVCGSTFFCNFESEVNALDQT